jgi:hypothetical protein
MAGCSGLGPRKSPHAPWSSSRRPGDRSPLSCRGCSRGAQKPRARSLVTFLPLASPLLLEIALGRGACVPGHIRNGRPMNGLPWNQGDGYEDGLRCAQNRPTWIRSRHCWSCSISRWICTVSSGARSKSTWARPVSTGACSETTWACTEFTWARSGISWALPGSSRAQSKRGTA